MEDRSTQRSLVIYTSAAHATVHATELMYAALLWRIGDTFGLDKLGLGLIANLAAFTFGAGALVAPLVPRPVSTLPDDA